MWFFSGLILGSYKGFTWQISEGKCIVAFEGCCIQVFRPHCWPCSSHSCISASGAFIPNALYLRPCAEVFFRCFCPGLLSGRRREKLRHSSPLWLSLQYFSSPRPACLFFPPAPGSIKHPEAFVQCSCSSEMTPTSVLIHLAFTLCSVPRSQGVLATCLYQTSKWLKPSLLLSFWLIFA